MGKAEFVTRFGDDLIAALGQALAHAQGDESAAAAVHRFQTDRGAVDVKAVRKRVGLTQEQMARIMDLSVSGYRKWEQGRRAVSGPARSLLYVMEREPEAVIRALSPPLGEGQTGKAGTHAMRAAFRATNDDAGRGEDSASALDAFSAPAGGKGKLKRGKERSAKHRAA